MKLDLKKLINNVLSRLVIHSVYFTATTSTAGQLALINLVPDDAQIISARCTSNSAYMCLPWMYTSSAGVACWYLRVMSWNSFATANSVSVTVRVRYILGGVLRKSVISTLSAISKIGGGVNDNKRETNTPRITETFEPSSDRSSQFNKYNHCSKRNGMDFGSASARLHGHISDRLLPVWRMGLLGICDRHKQFESRNSCDQKQWNIGADRHSSDKVSCYGLAISERRCAA